MELVPPRAAFADASLELRTNGTVQPEKLARFLEAHGYGRAGTVMEPGEYAMRGGIIDIFPAGETDPVRLDLFGDTIESIRVFDPGTQRSGNRRQRLTLRPVSEVPLDPDACRALLRGRPPHPGLAPHERLPDDSRLWAALQRASGGTWAGCVYDTDLILGKLSQSQKDKA